MSETIFTKRATSGQQIEVKAHEGTAGTFIAHLYVDGQFIGGPDRPQPLKTPKGDVTFALGGGYAGGKPAVGLSRAEAEVICRELDARRGAWKESQAGREYALRNERERLVAEVRGALEEQDAAFDRGMEHDGSAAHAARVAHQPAVDRAKTALAAFDANYPEVAHGACAVELPPEDA